jgi:hypothetical protein
MKGGTRNEREEVEIVGLYSTLVQNPKARNHLEDLDVDIKETRCESQLVCWVP